MTHYKEILLADQFDSEILPDCIATFRYKDRKEDAYIYLTREQVSEILFSNFKKISWEEVLNFIEKENYENPLHYEHNLKEINLSKLAEFFPYAATFGDDNSFECFMEKEVAPMICQLSKSHR